MLLSRRVLSRVRAFDIILNLGIHAHLLEPVFPENHPYLGENEPSLGFQFGKEKQLTFRRRDSESDMEQYSSAINNFESWLLVILFENLFLLVQVLQFRVQPPCENWVCLASNIFHVLPATYCMKLLDIKTLLFLM